MSGPAASGPAAAAGADPAAAYRDKAAKAIRLFGEALQARLNQSVKDEHPGWVIDRIIARPIGQRAIQLAIDHSEALTFLTRQDQIENLAGKARKLMGPSDAKPKFLKNPANWLRSKATKLAGPVLGPITSQLEGLETISGALKPDKITQAAHIINGWQYKKDGTLEEGSHLIEAPASALEALARLENGTRDLGERAAALLPTTALRFVLRPVARPITLLPHHVARTLQGIFTLNPEGVAAAKEAARSKS